MHKVVGRKRLDVPYGAGCLLTSSTSPSSWSSVGLNAPSGAGCFLTPCLWGSVVAPLPGAGAPPAPQASRGTGQHAPDLTTFWRPDAKRHRRPSGTFSHQLPTTSSQKVDVPDYDYRHVLPPLSVRRDLGVPRLGSARRPAESVSMCLLVLDAF